MVLTAQIQELRSTTEALEKASEENDVKISALRDEINQLKISMVAARNETCVNISVVDGKIEGVKQALGQMGRMCT